MESKEAKKGFKRFIIGILGYLMIALLANTILTYDSDNGFLIIGLELVLLAIFVNHVLGVLNGIRSITLKEKANWIKYSGLLGNIIAILAVGILLFFNSLEVMGYLNG